MWPTSGKGCLGLQPKSIWCEINESNLSWWQTNWLQVKIIPLCNHYSLALEMVLRECYGGPQHKLPWFSVLLCSLEKWAWIVLLNLLWLEQMTMWTVNSYIFVHHFSLLITYISIHCVSLCWPFIISPFLHCTCGKHRMWPSCHSPQHSHTEQDVRKGAYTFTYVYV